MRSQIQQAAERPERNFVDTRQLKVCATCFDLSVSLLRVLEMTVTLVPEIFFDWARPSAELLLRRLAQVRGLGASGLATAAFHASLTSNILLVHDSSPDLALLGCWCSVTA